MFSFLKKQSTDIPYIWNRFEKWLNKNASHLTSELNPPASKEKIDNLEKIIGVKLPQEFVEFLMIHNGQNRDSEGLINTEEFLSTERIIEEWNVWKELLDKGDFNDSESEPYRGIKKDWWNSKWIPITYDGHGNHYCIDLAPTSNGTSGQIIRMWHDSPERGLIAESFLDWVNKYVKDLEKGQYVYSEDWGGIIDKNDL